MTETSTTKKPNKKPAPVKYYGLVQINNLADPGGCPWTSEIVADSKSELYKALGTFDDKLEIKVLLLIRGRKIELTQKVLWKV